MGICPECGEEISYLRHYAKVEEIYEFTLDSGNPDYHHIDTIPLIMDDAEWECPECSEIVATSEGEAIKILEKI